MVIAVGLACLVRPAAGAERDVTSTSGRVDQGPITVMPSPERDQGIEAARQRLEEARRALAEAEVSGRATEAEAAKRRVDEAIQAQSAAKQAALREAAEQLQKLQAAVQGRPQPNPQPPPPAPQPQPGQPAVTPPPPPPLPPAPKNPINVQIDVTITDQMGSGNPIKKTVTLLAVDTTWGRIRANAMARPSERTGNVPVELNVDARPRILTPAHDTIQIELTMEYRPLNTVTSGDPSQVAPTNLNQSLTVILQNGKPLVVSQAADPVTDRKIVAEVKATVLKQDR
jgi:hypothetical protein